MALNRRQFGAAAAALAAGGLAAASTAAQDANAPTVSRAASELYRRAIVVDGNLAPPLEENLPLPTDNIAAVKGAGLTALKASIGGFNADFEATVAEIAFYLRVIEKHPETFAQVLHAADIAAAKRARKLGIIFSFESVEMLGDKVERIPMFSNLGVRVMQLSYNMASPFGGGVMAPEQGLTELGRQAIARMNDVGVALDLSHANPATTAGAIAASKKPVLITHAGCSAVHAHLCNKTDEQLRAVAQKGGVVGIYDLFYLAPSPRQPTVGDYMNHMTHALKTCGEDHVGIGSDTSFLAYDTSPETLAKWNAVLEARRKAGVAAPEEDRPPYVVGLNTPRRCEIIADALLKRGYPTRVAEKVLGANFLRAFGEIW